MKMTEHICPRCKRRTVKRDSRRCLNLDCLTACIFMGDDAREMQDEEYYIWMPKGPRGRGWYRRGMFESRPLVENNALDMQARAMAGY